MFRKLFWEIVFQASTKLQHEKTSNKPSKNHARTTKKTKCFSMSFLFVCSTKLEGFCTGSFFDNFFDGGLCFQNVTKVSEAPGICASCSLYKFSEKVVGEVTGKYLWRSLSWLRVFSDDISLSNSRHMQLSKSSGILLKCHFFFALSFIQDLNFWLGIQAKTLLIIYWPNYCQLHFGKKYKDSHSISKDRYRKIYLTRQT